jgi:oligosaccharide repeat unit polymerase
MSASLFAMFIFLEKIPVRKYVFLVITILFIGIYLMSGSRNMPLGLMIILMVAFNEIERKIPSLFFLAMIFGGVVIFYFISTVRIDSVSSGLNVNEFLSNSAGNSFFDFAKDLIINNRNLYVLVDFADTNGVTYGMTMLSSVLMLVPYAGTFVSESLGIPMDFLYVAGFNTYLEFGFGSTFGLGGNMVADIYLSFGFVGVLIAFTLLGLFMSKVIQQYQGNVKYFIIYCIMAGNSVFMNRESFLLPLRPIIYSIIMFVILNNLFKNIRITLLPEEKGVKNE